MTFHLLYQPSPNPDFYINESYLLKNETKYSLKKTSAKFSAFGQTVFRLPHTERSDLQNIYAYAQERARKLSKGYSTPPIIPVAHNSTSPIIIPVAHTLDNNNKSTQVYSDLINTYKQRLKRERKRIRNEEQKIKTKNQISISEIKKQNEKIKVLINKTIVSPKNGRMAKMQQQLANTIQAQTLTIKCEKPYPIIKQLKQIDYIQESHGGVSLPILNRNSKDIHNQQLAAYKMFDKKKAKSRLGLSFCQTHAKICKDKDSEQKLKQEEDILLQPWKAEEEDTYSYFKM